MSVHDPEAKDVDSVGPSSESRGDGSVDGGVSSEPWQGGSGSGGGLIGDVISITSGALPKEDKKVPKLDANGQVIPVLDAQGNPEYNADGTPKLKMTTPANPFTLAFPGAAGFVLGNNLGVTMAGNRYTHIIAGYEAKTTIDLEALIMGLLPAPGPGLGTLALGAWSLLSGMHGVVDLNIGQKMGVIYVGPKVDVTRGPTYKLERKEPKEWVGPMDTAAVVIGTLTFLSHIAGDIAMLVVSGYNGDSVAKVPPLALATLLPTMITSRIQALMNVFESSLAVAVTLKADATKAEAAAKTALKNAKDTVTQLTTEFTDARSGWIQGTTTFKDAVSALSKLKAAKKKVDEAEEKLKQCEARLARLAKFV